MFFPSSNVNTSYSTWKIIPTVIGNQAMQHKIWLTYYENIRFFKYHLQHWPNLFLLKNLFLSLTFTPKNQLPHSIICNRYDINLNITTSIVPSLSQQMREIPYLNINQILIRLSCVKNHTPIFQSNCFKSPLTFGMKYSKHLTISRKDRLPLHVHNEWSSCCKFWHCCLIADLMGTFESSHGQCTLQSGDDYMSGDDSRYYYCMNVKVQNRNIGTSKPAFGVESSSSGIFGGPLFK